MYLYDADVVKLFSAFFNQTASQVFTSYGKEKHVPAGVMDKDGKSAEHTIQTDLGSYHSFEVFQLLCKKRVIRANARATAKLASYKDAIATYYNIVADHVNRVQSHSFHTPHLADVPTSLTKSASSAKVEPPRTKKRCTMSTYDLEAVAVRVLLSFKP